MDQQQIEQGAELVVNHQKKRGEFLRKKAEQNRKSREKWRKQKQEQIEILYDLELQAAMAQECIDNVHQCIADIRAAGFENKRR